LKAGTVATALVLLTVYLYVPDRAVQFLAALWLLTLPVSFIWSRLSSRALKVHRTVQDLRVARGEQLELVLIVENRSLLPISFCAVSDTPGILSFAADSGRFLVSLHPREVRTLRYTVTGIRRGAFVVGPVRLNGADPLSLFPFQRVISDEVSVLVRPARIPLSPPVNRGLPQGHITLRDPRYEDTSMYRSIRNYRAGDELRRINWKASARLGELFTNEYLDTLSCPVFIFLDLQPASCPERQRHAHYETAIESAAALVSHMAQLRQDTGFASTGYLGDSGTHPFISCAAHQSEAILDILAAIIPAATDAPDAADLFLRARSVVPSGGRLYLVTPVLSPGMKEMSIAFKSIEEHVYECST